MNEKRSAIFALLLVGLAPTVSIFISFATDGGLFSQIAYLFSKLWMILIPLFWYLKIDGGKFSLSKPKNGGYLMSAGLGLGMSSLILATWFLVDDRIDLKLQKHF